MTINGVVVARHGQARGLPLVESHPKLLLAAGLLGEMQAKGLTERHRQLLTDAVTDDMADALVAAWCASRWYFRKWPFDLYRLGEDDLVFPAGRAVYPWPEEVPNV